MFLLLLASGCTSVKLRLPADEAPTGGGRIVYRGTRTDTAMLGPSAVLFGDAVKHPTRAQSCKFAVLLPYYILDIPFSFALDTICLPWDAVVAAQSEDSADDGKNTGETLWDDSVW